MSLPADMIARGWRQLGKYMLSNGENGRITKAFIDGKPIYTAWHKSGGKWTHIHKAHNSPMDAVQALEALWTTLPTSRRR